MHPQLTEVPDRGYQISRPLPPSAADSAQFPSGFSRTTARPCPTPTQIAATPHRRPVSRRSLANVARMRPPDAPSGRPMAIAPPCRLTTLRVDVPGVQADQRLGGERLVQLNGGDIGPTDTGFAQRSLRRLDRCVAEELRFVRSGATTGDPGEGRAPQPVRRQLRSRSGLRRRRRRSLSATPRWPTDGSELRTRPGARLMPYFSRSNSVASPSETLHSGGIAEDRPRRAGPGPRTTRGSARRSRASRSRPGHRAAHRLTPRQTGRTAYALRHRRTLAGP